jgi:hypothetical protein
MDLLTIDDHALLDRARRAGYTLVQRELEHGELVWTWRHSSDTRQPTFFDRTDAVTYMESRLRGTRP